MNPVLYKHQYDTNLLRPVCLGNNLVLPDSFPVDEQKDIPFASQYRCGPYYSCVTGLGTVNGQALAVILQSSKEETKQTLVQILTKTLEGWSKWCS